MANRVLNVKCPVCGKMGHERSRYELDGEIYIELECGHEIIKPALETEDISIVSKDGRVPFAYQMESAKFLEDADCNGLCLHEMGLGKTVIECLLLRRNKDLLPALIVVKSGLRAQWFAEIFRWTGMLAQVITSSKEVPHFDYFDIFIVSVDTLRILRPDVTVSSLKDDLKELMRNGEKKPPKKIIWTDEICAKFKHICVDESQKIKNPGSSRTQALRKIAKLANNGNKARVVCLSGTNIEKHAGEYFVTLNLVRPEIFPQQSTYQLQHCQVDVVNGKIRGLKYPDRFKQLTKDFIIRYKREEVLKDLPKVFRQFRLAELTGGALEAYIKVVKEFQRASDDPEVNLTATDILGYLSRMRHITGIAKVPEAVRFVEEFLLESERKIVIFLHHKQAGGILLAKLERLCKCGDSDLANDDEHGIDPKMQIFAPPLYLHSGLTLDQRTAVVEEFRKSENRIMLASTQAAGEGLNLQFCTDCLIMERQWNPSTEEQAEGRFPRPRGGDLPAWTAEDKINAHYLIAAGTIDDFLTDIVEMKRRDVAQTLDGKEVSWDEESLVAQLARALRDRGLAKWKL